MTHPYDADEGTRGKNYLKSEPHLKCVWPFWDIMHWRVKTRWSQLICLILMLSILYFSSIALCIVKNRIVKTVLHLKNSEVLILFLS